MPRPLMTWTLPPQHSKTQRGKHWCRAPLQSQVVKEGSCRASRHLLTYGFFVMVVVVVAVVAFAEREGKNGTFVGAGEESHRRETSVAAAVAAAAAACHRREMPYCYPFVGLRLPWPPRPDNHDRRQEHGGAMGVPGTGGEWTEQSLILRPPWTELSPAPPQANVVRLDKGAKTILSSSSGHPRWSDTCTGYSQTEHQQPRRICIPIPVCVPRQVPRRTGQRGKRWLRSWSQQFQERQGR